MRHDEERKKKSSQVSAKVAFQILTERGFNLVQDAAPPRTAFRKTIADVRNRRGSGTKTSITGHSIYLTRADGVTVFLPDKGMMGERAVSALQRATGINLVEAARQLHRLGN